MSQALRRSPRKRSPEASTTPQSANPSQKGRRTRQRQEPQLRAENTAMVNRGPVTSSAHTPESEGGGGPKASSQGLPPHIHTQVSQQQAPQQQALQDEGGRADGAHPPFPSVVSQHGHYTPSHGVRGSDTPTQPGPVSNYSNNFLHDDQRAYHAAFYPRAQYNHPDFRQPQSIPPQGAWPGYYYGAYPDPYAHSRYPPPNMFPHHHFNPAPSSNATPNAPASEASQVAHNAHLPDPQFGVDLARLAIPSQYPRTPSKRTLGSAGPDLPTASASPPPTQQRRSLTTTQGVQPIASPHPAPSDHTPQPVAQTPTPNTSIEPLIIQQPPATQGGPSQLAMAPSTRAESPMVLGELEEEESNDEDQTPDDADLDHSGIATSTQPRPAASRQYPPTGKSTQSKLKEKYDSEARARGYNPARPPSGANPWAGFVEGVGVGQEEDPRAFYRRNYLYPAFTCQSQNTRTYRRWLGDLMTRIEDISRRTGCLLYFVAHHPNSGQPYTWYASPKLRRKAPDALGEFHSLAAQTIIDINNAETGTKMGLVGELNKAKAQHKAALDEIQELKAQLQERNNAQAQLGRLQGL